MAKREEVSFLHPDWQRTSQVLFLYCPLTQSLTAMRKGPSTRILGKAVGRDLTACSSYWVAV